MNLSRTGCRLWSIVPMARRGLPHPQSWHLRDFTAMPATVSAPGCVGSFIAALKSVIVAEGLRICSATSFPEHLALHLCDTVATQFGLLWQAVSPSTAALVMVTLTPKYQGCRPPCLREIFCLAVLWLQVRLLCMPDGAGQAVRRPGEWHALFLQCWLFS